MNNRILIVDDEKIIAESLTAYLASRGYAALSAGNLAQARDMIAKEPFDLVLLDLKLPDGQGTDLLPAMAGLEEKPLVIVMTAFGTVEKAVSAMKSGVFDFIQKPFRTKDIELIVRLALETRKLDQEVRQLVRVQAEKYGIGNIIGVSKPMQDIFTLVKKVAKTGANCVLLLGESGTGKELVARAIHYESQRAIWPLVAINCSSIPAHLLESELYGHEKGSFTDARERKIGLFEKANKGSLLLDEIGDMDASLQTKLLRTIEDRKIRRIGGIEDISLDLQLIAATNQDLEKMVEEGRFRKDLYFRLKVLEIKIPPLRERREDIMPLAKFYLNHYNGKFGKQFRGICAEAEEMLIGYSYPGNVRELKNIIEKALILEDDEMLRKEHLVPGIAAGRGIETERHRSGKEDLYAAALSGGLELLVGGLERDIIARALEETNGNKTEAAKLLRVDRGTLRYKMKQYGLA